MTPPFSLFFICIGITKNTIEMKSIRRELQEYMENEVRKALDYSVNKEVSWEEIERVYQGLIGNWEDKHPIYNVSFETIYCDCIDIDHLELKGRGYIEYSEDVAKTNVSTILRIIERYRGVVLTDY